MKELEIAKVVYAKIIDAVETVRSDMKNEYDEDEIKDLDIAFPDSVVINGNQYNFKKDELNWRND